MKIQAQLKRADGRRMKTDFTLFSLALSVCKCSLRRRRGPLASVCVCAGQTRVITAAIRPPSSSHTLPLLSDTHTLHIYNIAASPSAKKKEKEDTRMKKMKPRRLCRFDSKVFLSLKMK